MKDHQIAELVNRITKEVQPLCPEHQSLRARVSSATTKHLKEIDDSSNLRRLLGNAADELDNYIADCAHKEAPEEIKYLRELAKKCRAASV